MVDNLKRPGLVGFQPVDFDLERVAVNDDPLALT
jgi:hypothetical protein